MAEPQLAASPGAVKPHGLARTCATQPAGAVIFLGGDGAGFLQRLDEREEGLGEIAEAADFGGPIVHLDVYVEVPVGVPRGLDFLGPDPLEIRGEAAGADEEMRR